MTSSEVEVELEAEWQQLNEDRSTLRSTFPTGNNRVSMKVVGMHDIMRWLFYCPRTVNIECSCNNYCDLIGHSEVSISHKDLQV